ncbi:MAG: hypothetical protein ACQZ2J_30010 [Pseudomonas piscis]|uniref:hypothetical protein n=1 Tax=Pseudomonas piscis TaxID=2614538 RepID=UPI003D2726DF
MQAFDGEQIAPLAEARWRAIQDGQPQVLSAFDVSLAIHAHSLAELDSAGAKAGDPPLAPDERAFQADRSGRKIDLTLTADCASQQGVSRSERQAPENLVTLARRRKTAQAAKTTDLLYPARPSAAFEC